MQICFELLSIVFHFIITTSRIFDPLHRIVIEGNLEFSCPYLLHHHCLFKGALAVRLLFKRSIQPLLSQELLLIEKKGVHIETETKQGHVETVNMITCTTAPYNILYSQSCSQNTCLHAFEKDENGKCAIFREIPGGWS